MGGQGALELRSRYGRARRATLAALGVLGAFWLLPALSARGDVVPSEPARSPAPKMAATKNADRNSPPITVDANGVTTSYGYAVFGKLKYGPNFKHFDYANPDAPKGGTYRYGQSGSFDTLTNTSLLGAYPLAVIYVNDPLMRPSADEPASHYPLICDWVRYPRDLSWMEYHIDHRARWNDGQPITVDDVIFTIRMSKEKLSPVLKRTAEAVDHYEKVAPDILRVYFTGKNNPTLPFVLMDMYVLPKHYWEHRDITASTLEPPVTSGPYKIGKFSAGRWIELDRVKDYWAKDLPANKGRYNFDVIRHDFYRDTLVANEAFWAGHEDAKIETSASQWGADEQRPAFRSHDVVRRNIAYGQPSWYQGLIFNTRIPFLADRRVRQALQLAYDFEWVKRVLYDGYNARLRSYFPNSPFEARGLPSADELKFLEPLRKELPPELFTKPVSLPIGGTWANRRQNLLKAAALLEEAGYHVVDGHLIDKRTRQPVRLKMLAYSALMDKQVSLFQENMRQLGVEIDFRSADSALFRHLLRHYDYDLLMPMPLLSTTQTPGVGLLMMWSSKAANTPQQLNYPGVRNPAVDSLLQTIVSAKDRPTVVNAMQALDRVLQWNYYSIPLQHGYPAAIGEMPLTYWDKFGRPAKDPLYNFPIMTLDSWWIDPAKAARISNGRSQ